MVGSTVYDVTPDNIRRPLAAERRRHSGVQKLNRGQGYWAQPNAEHSPASMEQQRDGIATALSDVARLFVALRLMCPLTRTFRCRVCECVCRRVTFLLRYDASTGNGERWIPGKGETTAHTESASKRIPKQCFRRSVLSSRLAFAPLGFSECLCLMPAVAYPLLY